MNAVHSPTRPLTLATTRLRGKKAALWLQTENIFSAENAGSIPAMIQSLCKTLVGSELQWQNSPEVTREALVRPQQ